MGYSFQKSVGHQRASEIGFFAGGRDNPLFFKRIRMGEDRIRVERLEEQYKLLGRSLINLEIDTKRKEKAWNEEGHVIGKFKQVVDDCIADLTRRSLDLKGPYNEQYHGDLQRVMKLLNKRDQMRHERQLVQVQRHGGEQGEEGLPDCVFEQREQAAAKLPLFRELNTRIRVARRELIREEREIEREEFELIFAGIGRAQR